MTVPDLETLAARIASGESLDAALRALQPRGQTELLRRCAAVHQFDEALVDVLRAMPPTIEDAGLDELRGAGLVEPVPGSEGVYRLPAVARREHYASWWTAHAAETVPEPLRELSRRVLAHLETTHGSEAEKLYHLLIVEPDAGLEHFVRMFDQADAAFELGRCQDLVDVVVERLALLGPEGAAVCNRYKRRLRSRSMWMLDWERSSRFLLPAPSAAATDELLSGDGLRVLSLWSPGGMGKSSYLRWLIARRCVPGGDACARIDFDDVDPLLAGAEPWLLLLEAAHQLDQQLTDAPFHELLRQYPGQRERLYRQGTTGASVEAAAPDIRRRFGAALRELDASHRVVIALDTLEQLLLLGGRDREQPELTRILEQFHDLLDIAPALRLVLTARYDISESVPFEALFPRARTLQLGEFSDAEARRYLTDYRGITSAPLIDRIVQSARGVPFKLALIADVAERKPDLDPSELDDYVNPDLAYVMDRILKRIDPDLRAFLLYGVAPRTLERRFAREVLAPLLGTDGARGEAAWRELKRYAGTASWVTLDPADVDAVRFHPAVLEPVRRLLQASPEHDELHGRAAEWFEQRAEEEPARATRWLCEAVYHRFQQQGPRARRYWETCLREARAERRPDRRRALAAEVLREDYVDEQGPRAWRGQEPLLTREALLRARWELAFAAVQLAHPDTPDRRDGQWMEAERALADLEHLRRAGDEASLTESRMALLLAGLRLVQGRLADAKPQIEIALRGKLAGEDRLWLWLAYAAAVSARGGEEAAEHFRTALATAKRGRNPDVDLAAVYQRLAFHYADQDHLDRALRACAAGARHASGRQAVELALVRVQLELRRGAPIAALDALPDVAGEEADVQARREILRARALLAAGHPIDALEVADETARRYRERLRGAGDREWAIAAEGRELRGKVRAALLDVEGAVTDLEEAANRWSRLGATDGVCRSWVRGAALQLRGVGNLHEAAALLDQARRTRVRRGNDAWTRCGLVGADLLLRSGKPERAARVVDDVIRGLQDANRPPRSLIAAAVGGLTVTRGSAQDPYLRLLCDQLSRVSPPSARLALLDGIQACPPLSGSAELRARLRRLVPSPLRTVSKYADLPAPDRAQLALVDAELDRIVGHAERSRATLEHLWPALTADMSSANLHALVAGAVRAEARPLVEQLAGRELCVLTPEGRATPIRDGAALVEAATVLPAGAVRTRLLEIATTLLEAEGSAAGAWPARLLELRAEDDERAGRADAARALRALAAEFYEALGDEPRRDRVLRGKPSGIVAPVAERELRVTVRLRDGELTVGTQSHGGETRIVRDTSVLPPLLDGPAERVVDRVLSDPRGLSEELAALLRRAVPAGESGPLDLGLRSKHAAVRMLPWELAVPALEGAGLNLFRRSPRTRGEPADIRAVQGTLNRLGKLRLSPDGNLGPDTRIALERFQQRVRLPVTGRPDPHTVQRLHAAVAGEDRPLVAIVRPSRVAEERAARGSRQSGVPVDWAYQRAGFRTLVLESLTSDELTAVLDERPVAILHLNVGLVDHHGTPAIDLLAVGGMRRGPATAGRLTGTALDRLIPRHVIAPLVVLDIAAPRSRRETVAQLLLRNIFAAELASVGTVRAVLATGLARYQRQERLISALIDALGAGQTASDAVGAVRGLVCCGDAPGLDDALAFTSAALFARSPDVRFPAPR